MQPKAAHKAREDVNRNYIRVRNKATRRLNLIFPILFISLENVWYDMSQTQQLLRATSLLSPKDDIPVELPVDAEYITVAGGEVVLLEEENKEIANPFSLYKLDQIQTVCLALPPYREELSNVKLLIYMTTHLSDQHISFLPCWNDAIQQLPIFWFADLMLYTALLPSDDILQLLSPFRNIIVKLYNNTGYQAGAIQAMKDPFLDYSTSHTTWFDEYDWVIRLNPDVLIQHDDWLIETMLNDNIDGIFHDCYNSTEWMLIHSDFYAFRPRAINPDAFLLVCISPEKYQSNAEHHVTDGFRNIYESGRMTFVKDAINDVSGYCRIGGINSPIIHNHKMVTACPYYYNYTIPRSRKKKGRRRRKKGRRTSKRKQGNSNSIDTQRFVQKDHRK